MKQFLQCLSFGAILILALTAPGDVIEKSNGTKVDGDVQGFFKQRFEIADNNGNITRLRLTEVKRVQFAGVNGTLVTTDHKTSHGELHNFENGVFTLTDRKGVKQQVAAQLVNDLMLSKRTTVNPSPPSAPPAAPRVTVAAKPVAAGSGSADAQPGKITIIDFYADWCRPCRSISPVLDKIVAGDPGIVLRKVNIDQHQELARQHGVRSIPHIEIYDKTGKKVATIIGANEGGVRRAITQANQG